MGAAADVSRSPAPFWQWVRHHLAGVAATVIDYALMVVCVELLHMRPVPATVAGAFVGAVANFTLNRFFTYRIVGGGDVARQTWRYALTSVASLALNAAGEHLFSDVLGLQYLLARIITSVIVSNAWNYPLQRFFVFSRRPPRSVPPQ